MIIGLCPIIFHNYSVCVSKIYLGSHFPVILFLRVPLGHRLGLTESEVFLSHSPVLLFLRLPLGHRLVVGVVFLSHFPVILFLRLPLGQRFFFSIGEVVSGAWSVLLMRGLSIGGVLSLGGVLFCGGVSSFGGVSCCGRGIVCEKFEEGDGYIEGKCIEGVDFVETGGRGIVCEKFEEGDGYIEDKCMEGVDFSEIVETEGIECEIDEGTFVSIVKGGLVDDPFFGCGIAYENFEEGDDG
jgi:hypothetical protein